MHCVILFQYLYENCSLLLAISYQPIIIELVTLTVMVECIILVKILGIRFRHGGNKA